MSFDLKIGGWWPRWLRRKYQGPVWNCFFCGEKFITPEAARDHFGDDPMCYASCQIKAGKEQGLVRALRQAEAELAAYRSESDEESKKSYVRQSEHRQAIISAEEAGYNKGVADMRAELAHELSGRGRPVASDRLQDPLEFR